MPLQLTPCIRSITTFVTLLNNRPVVETTQFPTSAALLRTLREYCFDEVGEKRWDRILQSLAVRGLAIIQMEDHLIGVVDIDLNELAARQTLEVGII